MAPTCLHGLPPGECLICRTLGIEGGGTTAPERGRPAGRVTPGPARSGPEPAQVIPGPARSGYPRSRGVGHLVGWVAAGVVIAGVAAWLLLGVAFAVLHLLELVVVAGAAGWVGYRVGHFRGRRDGRS